MQVVGPPVMLLLLRRKVPQGTATTFPTFPGVRSHSYCTLARMRTFWWTVVQISAHRSLYMLFVMDQLEDFEEIEGNT